MAIGLIIRLSVGKKLINCDLGECQTPNPDTQLMPLIDIANIACGGHTGDRESMAKSIQLARKYRVKISAHISYADVENFGRVSQNVPQNELYNLLNKQILTLQKLCDENQVKLEYLKPHGGLYHDMVKKPQVLQTLIKLIQTIDKSLTLIVPAGFNFKAQIARQYEVFADRVYKNRAILPRSEQGSVLNDANKIIKQYQKFLRDEDFYADTICFHSDNPASVVALKQIKKWILF